MTPRNRLGASPPLGRDTAAILASVGYTQDQITNMMAVGVIPSV